MNTAGQLLVSLSGSLPTNSSAMAISLIVELRLLAHFRLSVTPPPPSSPLHGPQGSGAALSPTPSQTPLWPVGGRCAPRQRHGGHAQLAGTETWGAQQAALRGWMAD